MSADLRRGAARPLAEIATYLTTTGDPAELRLLRLAVREEALLARRQRRKFESSAKLADAVAKFGGGSLLTATLLLIVSGKVSMAIVVTAALALVLFVAGTIFWRYCDLQAAQRDFEAERLEAALKETER